jgi:hypothetical protein
MEMERRQKKIARPQTYQTPRKRVEGKSFFENKPENSNEKLDKKATS